MPRAFAYLGAGHSIAPWPGPPAPPPAAHTYTVAANGLFVHVTQGTFRGTLPLAFWPTGAIRGLQPLTPLLGADLQESLARLLDEQPCPPVDEPLAVTVARPR